MGSLAGKRIVITRPPHKAGEFADQLRALGAEPVLLPTITIRAAADSGPLDAALARVETFDWMIFTSANAVEHVWQRAEALGLADVTWPRIAVIGPATADALRKHGLTPDVMPDRHVAEALFETLVRHTALAGMRVLLPQANLARPALADLLRGAGAVVEACTAYETVRPENEIGETALGGPVDAITFTSSSSVQHFVEMIAPDTIGAARVACIGPVTADTARALGVPVHIVAEPHTVEGLIAALCESFERDSTL